jgi:2-oxoglutarate ferredoxin oxidoreductase subunit beta
MENNSDFSIKKITPTWCPGCGIYTYYTALKQSLNENSDYNPENTVIVSGIGCSALLPYYLKSYSVCSIHGRAVPFATGVKIANRDLKVVVSSGDGDLLGIGMGHYLHMFRRNLDITLFIQNNGVYGLTKGQTAPTSDKGFVSSSTPYGSPDYSVDALKIALAQNANFVARVFSGDFMEMKKIISLALKFKGTAVVDVIQPCVSFNKEFDYNFYKENTFYLKEKFETREEAFSYLSKTNNKIPLGVFYSKQEKTYEEESLPENALAKQALEIDNLNLFFDKL